MLRKIGFVIGLVIFTASAQAQDYQNYIRPVPTSSEMIARVEEAMGQKSQNTSKDFPIGGFLGQITNLAKPFWDVIVANRPVVNVQSDYANAIPNGMTSSILQGFSPIQYQSFEVWGEGPFGYKPYTMIITTVHQFGGSFQGKGQYLESVSIVPQNISVMTGFTIGMAVKQVSASNVGSDDMPIANIVMDAEIKIENILQTDYLRVIYEFRGDSATAREVGTF